MTGILKVDTLQDSGGNTILSSNGSGGFSNNLPAGKTSSFRNRVINGDLSVWQRGTSFTDVASGTYTADRWNMSYRAIGNADIVQVDNKTYKSLKVTNSNASSQEIAMRYRVEDVTQFNNDSFILSFYAKASTSVTLDTRVYENYGSGGSSTVTVVAAGSQNKTITTSRERFTISFTTSDMSGKTIGSSNYLEFSFHPTLAASENWEFDSVQLEKGTVASDFEFLPYDVNLQRCKRYTQYVCGNSNIGELTGGFRTTGTAQCGLQFTTPMRAAPSISLVGLRLHDLQDGDNLDVTSIGVVNGSSSTGTWFNMVNSGTGTVNGVCILYGYNASPTAGIQSYGVKVDAEL